MKAKTTFLLLCICSLSLVRGQKLLTLEEAIKTALEKNYEVQIFRNQQAITQLQNNSGNAGLSPTVSLNGNLNLSSLNSHQEFNTGAVQDRSGAKASNLGVSLNASWTIFDGLKMFAVKKRLDLNERNAAVNLKAQMEQTVYSIISGYYAIARVSKLLEVSKQNLAIYEERKKIADYKLSLGSGSKVDALLTQNLYNKAQSEIWQLELQLLNAKTQLNTLMAVSAAETYDCSDTTVVNYNPELEELRKNYRLSNTGLLLSRQTEEATLQSVREARSGMFPYLQLNGAYNFTRNSSEAGIVFLNRQNGLSAGFTAGWTLFNGNKTNKLVKERTILAMNQSLQTKQLEQELDANVFIAYQSFTLQKKIVGMERQNLRDAAELLYISLARYKEGKAILLETMEAQKQLEEAQNRYYTALYALKMSETDLLKATGALLN